MFSPPSVQADSLDHESSLGPLFLPENVVLDVTIQLADALDYCHRQVPGILHKDIKPDNVLLLSGYHIKLCDFGSIEVIESGGIVKSSRKSTLQYMAPEIVDDNLIWTTKCDVFSLGCTLYELASCEAASPGQIVDQDDLPLDLPDEFSPEFNELVKRCMAISVADRPDASQVLAEATKLRNRAAPTNGTTMQSSDTRPLEDDGSDRSIGREINGDAANLPTQSALHWAAVQGDDRAVELTKLLLSIQEDVNISDFVNERDRDGLTPLWWAIERGHTTMAELLLDNQATFDTDRRGGVTALIKAIDRNYGTVVERLLSLPDSGVNVTASTTTAGTPLRLAALHRNVEIAQLLLKRGANVDAPDADDRTALRQASDQPRWKEMMELLLPHGDRIESGTTREGQCCITRQ